MESRTRGSLTKGRRLSMCKSFNFIEECDVISDRISGIKKSTVEVSISGIKKSTVEVRKLGLGLQLVHYSPRKLNSTDWILDKVQGTKCIAYGPLSSKTAAVLLWRIIPMA